MMKCIIGIIIIILLIPTTIISDEGMWPITEIHRLNLQEKGLKVPINEIFNPEGVSLVHAIVRLSGCTASFVSPEGLILTNHHCAFRAVQMASNKENDYLTDGFLAADRSREIPAKGYTASIVESYRDVSTDILSVITNNMDAVERTKAIEKKQKEIIAEAEKANPGKRAEISEMFIGKTYYLFIYTYLRDIRMVYIPPRAIGEFGGETDNWIWPRHTGDFSFFRAYVAPDGQPAAYAEENVPYTPVQHFQVAPKGVNEDDFLFILGFPGRTYRHRSSHYLKYENEIRMPKLADWYEWQINLLTEFSEKDPDVALRVASRIKSLANRMKNYRGKLTGLSRLDLIQQRADLETNMQRYIEADEKRKKLYGDVLMKLQSLYAGQREKFERRFVLDQLTSVSTILANAIFVLKAVENLQIPDLERERAYMNRNFSRNRDRRLRAINNFHPESEQIFLSAILERAIQLADVERILELDELLVENDYYNNPESFVGYLYENSKLSDADYFAELLQKNPDQIQEINDPALKMMNKLIPVYDDLRDQRRRYQGTLAALHRKLLDIRKKYLDQSFVPDANSSLRLTYGYVRGYQPKDAVYYSPITFFKGVIEKTTQQEPFITPKDLIDLHQEKDFGQFRHPVVDDVPVAILYNTDTSGGNSGSPILNANGQLVGVNFDRAWEATINDYGWSEAYSRSIGVDIRYVLWVTQKLAGADYLLQEMNVIN